MKKIIFTLTTMILTACSLACCKASSSKAQASTESKEAAVAAEELIVNTDSCVEEEGNSLRTCIKVDYPTEPTQLSQNVRKILNQELGNLLLSKINGEEVHNIPIYTGDLANGNTVLKYYTDTNYGYLSKQLKDIKDADPKADISMSYDVVLSKKEETDSYITYNSYTYAFLGGAHGSCSDYSFNINKATGKVLSLSVDTTQIQKLQPILRKGVLHYLTAQDPDTQYTDSTLNEYLFIDNGIISLPSHTPYLAKDGVHFIYQQYEIGPYAMGMVEFTVPYSDIKAYLTSEALQLLK